MIPIIGMELCFTPNLCKSEIVTTGPSKSAIKYAHITLIRTVLKQSDFPLPSMVCLSVT